MRIVIARHATADDPEAKNDAARRLSPGGRKEAELMGKLLAATLRHVDEIWTSPLVRARQTAEIVAERLGIKFKEEPALAIDGDHDELCWKIAHSKAGTLMLTGHQPDQGRLAARLLGLQSTIDLKKGGICIVDTPDAMGAAGRAIATLRPDKYQDILDGKEYVPWMVRKQLL